MIARRMRADDILLKIPTNVDLVGACFERTHEIPFNSRIKWMITVYQGTAEHPQVIETLFGADMTNAGNPASEKDSELVFVKDASDVLFPYFASSLAAVSNTPRHTLTTNGRTSSLTFSRHGLVVVNVY